jgi:hypothetical protein
VAAPIQRESSGSRGGTPFSEASFSAVVNQADHKAALKSCYERALKRDDKLKGGRLDVTVNVGQTGTVKSVSVNAPPDFGVVSTCIKDAVRRWRFPTNDDAYEASFPLLLQGS